MESLKIAMVAACPFPAAFASSGLIRELSLELSARGHEVDVVTYHLGDPNINAPGVTIHRIPNIPGYNKLCSGISPGKPLLDLMLCRKLLNVCRHKQFDVIHAHNYEAPPAAYYVRKKLGIPVVYHAHNTMFHELPTYFRTKPIQSLARLAGNWMDNTIPHRADHILTVSDEQANYLVKIGIPINQITTLLPSIDSNLFSNGKPGILRDLLGIGNSPLILYTGGLQPYQNCQALIKVLHKCQLEIPDMHLLILARSAPEWLKDLAITTGVFDRVHFIQRSGTDFEADCLAAADVGIIPRLDCIGYPIKLLNYISARLPVVCFQGLNKGFKNEIDVLAVPNGDTDAMANAIIRVVKSSVLSDQLVQNSYKTLIKNHSWKKGIDDLEQVYCQLLESSGLSSRQKSKISCSVE